MRMDIPSGSILSGILRWLILRVIRWADGRFRGSKSQPGSLILITSLLL